MGSDEIPSGPQPEPEMESLVIWTLNDVIEAELARDALSEAGIDCAIVPHNDFFWFGVMPIPLVPKAWGVVRVPPEDREQAESVLAEALSPPAPEGLPDDRPTSPPEDA